MRLIKKIKKGTAVILSAALMAGLVPFMPHSVSKVQAAAGSKEPSVTAYATKEQLMDKTFTPNYKGISDIVGKLAFGNDEDGNIQEWYILGKDGGVNNVKDNTIIFAADSIKKEQIFEDISSGSTTKTYKEEYGNYGNNAPQEVYASHYGASELRKVLQDMVRDDNDTYFSDAEKAIMNEVKVTTEDSDYKRYTISDKLYAPGCDSYNYLSHKELLIAVNTNTKKIASSIYWAVGEPFWTRTPRYGGSISELTANPYEIQNSYRIEGHDVNEKLAVRPLANLNLATVLFASSATAATSDSAVYGTIAEGTAMRLRINGKNKDIGSVYYNFENGYIRATKGSISDTVSLVIQGNDGTNDWYYSKKIDKTDTVKVSDIQRALNISDDIDWRNCQIWLETTDEDRMTYAVPAEISTVFATKDQLMDSVLHYDGTPDCIGKLELGKNEDGAYSWYILGKDNNIDGDNTVIFTVSPLATGIKFNPDNNDVTFQEGMGTYTYYDYVPTTVSSDHYGACELRQNLLSIADSSRFTATEKSLMQATTLNMWDTLNSDSYTVSDKLSLAPTRLDAHKKKTAYEAGEILNVDDITVTAYYEDGYSEQITAYTTNADELDMNTVGEKILAVSYTKNGDTKTCRFKIIVTHTHGFDNAVWHSDSINHWKECTKSYCDKSDGYKIQEISHTCEYTYTWSDDYKTCTAVRKCSICEYTDSETAASDIVVVQNRDCTNPEIIEYVARFKNSLYNDFETQIKGNFEAAPATGHNMSEWTSNRDNTHSRICTNSGCTYKETEKCSGGTATYFKKAICDDCKAEHGDFKADTIKPTGEIKLSDNTWNTLLNKITFGRFFSATQKVTIAGTDDSYSSDGFNLSEDAVKISYLIASGDEAKVYTTDELEKRFTAGEFKNYKASFNVNPDNKYVVFARIEDHAGNATYISSDGVVIDSTTPVIDGVAEGEIYCEKVEFTVSDDNFDKVTDIIGDDVQTLTSINGRYILADGMHKVIAYDKAGNSTEVNFVVNANHTVSEWMTDKEATIEETGSRHKECKVCGTILEKADIEKLVPLEYKIIAGADSSWSQNTDMNLVIKGNGDFAKFIRIKVDGVSVDATNYTVAEGSTIITLKPDYIKTLSVGSHVFEIIWKDGIASTSFTIVNNEVADTNNNQGTDITQTGDTAKPLLWSMLFMVSFAGFAVMSGRRKKKNCK